MTRVLIAAAYASIRLGLHALLAARGHSEIVGHASNPSELESLLESARPDVVLLDLPEASDEAEQSSPRVLDVLSRCEVGVVLIGDSAHDFEELLARPLRGWAWLAREAEGAEIDAAIQAAASGLAAFDRSRLALLLAPQNAPRAPAGDSGALTSREREVLQLLASGLPNKSIAHRLGISTHTAKFHVASILSKLGAASRTEAVSLGARGGYLML